MSQETRAAVAISRTLRAGSATGLSDGYDDVPGMRRRECGKLPFEFDAIGELAVYGCTTGRRIVPGGIGGRISGRERWRGDGFPSLRSIFTEASIPVQ